MSINTGRSKLHLAYKQLQLQWENAGDHWHDAASRKFQEEHLEVLEPLIQDAVRGMDQLAEVFAKAKQDCQ